MKIKKKYKNVANYIILLKHDPKIINSNNEIKNLHLIQIAKKRLLERKIKHLICKIKKINSIHHL